MKGVKEAFIDAGEISQMLGIGMTKAYAIIKEYNAELEAKVIATLQKAEDYILHLKEQHHQHLLEATNRQ